MFHWVMVRVFFSGAGFIPPASWLQGGLLGKWVAIYLERIVPEQSGLRGSANALIVEGRLAADVGLPAGRPESLQGRFPIGAIQQQRYPDY